MTPYYLLFRPWFAVFSKKRPTLTPELKESRFNDSQNRRREAFEESGLERQRQFFDEEKIQWEVEGLRATEFEKLMTVVEEVFLQKQNFRDVAFQNWDAEKEATYERNETARDARFEVAEDRRDSLFRSDHDTRLARSEWYADVRLQHIQRGHHVREQACEQLEKEMADQFEIISRFLDDALAAAERRRDPFVEQSANQVTSSETIISPSSGNHFAEDGVDARNEAVRAAASFSSLSKHKT